MSGGTIEGWVMTSGGDSGLCDIGMINGVKFCVAWAIHEQLQNDISDFICDEDMQGARLIEFTLSNISFNEGQMSFPETGQWDFPPHFEFVFTVTKNEIIEESL